MRQGAVRPTGRDATQKDTTARNAVERYATEKYATESNTMERDAKGSNNVLEDSLSPRLAPTVYSLPPRSYPNLVPSSCFHHNARAIERPLAHILSWALSPYFSLGSSSST